jgi:hypothetical protein
MNLFFQKYWKILIIVALILLLYPKEIGFNYGGFVLPPEGKEYREEKTCIGFKYSMYDGPFLTNMQCNDCSEKVYCIGIPLNKKCYEKNFTRDNNDKLVYSKENEVKCVSKP